MATPTQINKQLRQLENKVLAGPGRPFQRTKPQLRGALAKKGKPHLDVNNARHDKPLRVKRRIVLARVQEGGGLHPYRVQWLDKLGKFQALPLMTREQVRSQLALLRREQMSGTVTITLTKI